MLSPWCPNDHGPYRCARMPVVALLSVKIASSDRPLFLASRRKRADRFRPKSCQFGSLTLNDWNWAVCGPAAFRWQSDESRHSANDPFPDSQVPDTERLVLAGGRMTEDARNSIYLWAASLAVFGFLWADISFDLLPSMPNEWTPWIIGGTLLLNLVQMALHFWRRRSSMSDDATPG